MKNGLAFNALAVFFASGSITAQAQSYPVKPIRVIVPFTAGGPSDVVMRTLASRLTEALGQPIVIDNRGGAGGVTGTEIATKASPDGYTLLHGTIGGIGVAPSLHPKLPYNPVRDLAPITQTVNVAYVAALHPSVPAKSMKELIALAKSRPGKMNYGSSGSGTGGHLAGELLNMMAGTQIVHVPYKGSAPAQTALMSGEVDLTFENTLIVLPHVKAGRVRPIAATGAQRSKLMPDLPTIAESGWPGYSATGWYGLLAPAATSKDVIARINTEATRLLRGGDVADKLNSMAAEPAPGTPEQFAAFIRNEIDKWAKVVKAAGMKAE